MTTSSCPPVYRGRRSAVGAHAPIGFRTGCGESGLQRTVGSPEDGHCIVAEVLKPRHDYGQTGVERSRVNVFPLEMRSTKIRSG